MTTVSRVPFRSSRKKPPIRLGRATGEAPASSPTCHAKHFVETLEAARATIILPTPALSEFLVLAAGDTGAYVAELTNGAVLVVEPFDLKAAIEAAESQRRAIRRREQEVGSDWPMAEGEGGPADRRHRQAACRR